MNIVSRLAVFLAAVMVSLTPASSVAGGAARDPSILVVIESPGDIMSGIGLVHGYALSKKGSIDLVQWWVDGEDKGVLPYGGSRGDVEAAHPGYADSARPGFASVWNYNLFPPGEHQIIVRAYDDQGGYNEASKTFHTVRFGDGSDKFLRAGDLELEIIPLRGLQLHPSDPTGDRFDVDLMWSPVAQQFVIESIDLVCRDCAKLSYTAPTLDAVTARGGGSVEITWSGGSPVMAYEVERRSVLPFDVPGPWELAAIAGGTESSAIDDPPNDGGGLIVVGSVWEYRVRGLGTSAKSDYSNTKTIPMPVP